MIKTKPAATKKAAPAKKIAKRKLAAEAATKTAAVAPVEAAAPAAPGKAKLVRDSFTMPSAEYDLLAELKRRLLARSKSVKKSELLRAGVAALAAMTDAKLLAAIERVPNLKTGRPKKDKAAKAAKKSA